MFASSKKYSKALFLAGLLFAAFLMSIIPLSVATAATSAGDTKPVFTDLPADNPLYPFVRYLIDKGIINGFPDGTYRPLDSVTRAEAAKVMALAKGLQEVKGGTPTYSDVPAGYWAFGAIEAATKAGLFKGYPDGTFSPDGAITRVEAITLLMNLSGGELSSKTIEIGDVKSDNWAYKQVVTAVETGMVQLSADKLFKPGQEFKRDDLARSLSEMFTLSPVLRAADLTGKLTVKKGKVTVTGSDGSTQEVSGETKLGAGFKIVTGNQGQAEITFDDGSGILIEANTEIAIKKSNGFNYMHKDGSPGVAVDKLEADLKKGKIFGALATRYDNAQNTGSNKTAFLGGPLLGSNGLPPGLADTLPSESNSKNTAWWNEPYAERERLVVHMPWGVCSIRGTFWMNSVSADQCDTALIIGKADVTSGGHTVAVTTGQSSAITSSNAPPATPAAQTQAERDAFAGVKAWVNERAQDIQNNLPPLPAPAVFSPDLTVPQQTALGQDSNIVGIITQSLEQATSTAPTTPTSSGGGGSSNSSIDNYAGDNYGGLSSLTLSHGTLSPATSSINSYYATVANSVYSITVTPTLTDSLSTVTVNNVPVTSGQPSGAIGLNVG
ncbi:MAG: S-layer homology domain-containing protein, partial [Smithella sp.]